MKLLDIYPGDGKPTEREKQIFNDVLDRVNSAHPVMMELGCYNAFWSLTFRERFKHGWNILNDINGEHLDVGIENFEMNGYRNDKDFIAFFGPALDYTIILDNQRVDILHMDMQGAEWEFLHMADLSNVKNIVIATHSDRIHAQCLRLL